MFQLQLLPTLLVILVIIGLLAYLTRHKDPETPESLQLDNREVPPLVVALAIAANWTQTPAIYGSGYYAALGPWPFAMFSVPNVLAIGLLLGLTLSARQLLPKGFNNPQYMGEVYGPTTRTMSLVLQLTFLLGGGTLGVVAISDVIAGLGLNHVWLTSTLVVDVGPVHVGLALAVVAVLWVIFTGLRPGLVGDCIKIACLCTVVAGVAYLWYRGLRSYQATPTISLPSPPLGTILWQKGVPLTLGLFSAVLCASDMAERGYALRLKDPSDPTVVRLVYYGAMGLFVVFLLAFGSIGPLAMHTITEKFNAPPLIPVMRMFGTPNMHVIFSILLILIMVAGFAAYALSAGSLLSIEIHQRYRLWKDGVKPTDRETVRVTRISMLLYFLAVAGLSHIPGIKIPVLLEWAAAFRGQILFPMRGAPVLLRYGVPTRAYDRWIGGSMLVGLLVSFVFLFSSELFGSTSLIAMNAKPLAAISAVLFPIAGALVCWSLLRRRTSALSTSVA